MTVTEVCSLRSSYSERRRLNRIEVRELSFLAHGGGGGGGRNGSRNGMKDSVKFLIPPGSSRKIVDPLSVCENFM